MIIFETMDVLKELILSMLAIVIGLATAVAIIVLLILPYILLGWLIWFFLAPISETLAMVLIIGLAIIWAFGK